MDLYCHLIKTLIKSKDLLNLQNSPYKEIFSDEHIAKLAKNLLSFYQKTPLGFPEPHFSVECTPPLEESFTFFRTALENFVTHPDNIEHNSKIFEQCFREIPCVNVLILLGQRLTPASIIDERAIPPTQEKLMSSAMQEGKQGLSVAARAWSKHVNRHPDDNYWGEISGNAKQKNEGVQKILLHILNNTTWWNIFSL